MAFISKKTITYKNKEYTVVFNLNVMQAIQEKYETVDKWAKLTDGASGEVDIKALIFGLKEMINEGIEIDNEDNGTDIPLMTDKQIGRMVSEIGFEDATKALNDTVIDATKDDSGKNA